MVRGLIFPLPWYRRLDDVPVTLCRHPLDFIVRLAVLGPPSGANLMLFQGVFAGTTGTVWVGADKRNTGNEQPLRLDPDCLERDLRCLEWA